MKPLCLFWILCASAILALPVFAADAPAPCYNGDRCESCQPPSYPPTPPAPELEDQYMGLSQGPLRHARVKALAKGVVLTSCGWSITAKEVDAEIAKAQPEMRAQMKKQTFFVLEQIATKRLLLQEARDWAKEAKRDTKKDTDADQIQAFLQQKAGKATVTDAEVRSFYDANTEMMGGATCDAAAKDIRAYLLDQKQKETVNTFINTLSERIYIDLDATWVKAKAATALDNPVDKARRSGKPSVVDFGADGCRPCEMMAPILADLKKTSAAQCNVLFTHVRQEQVLAMRYGISSIPVQVFFDKAGKEVFRHVGFYPKEQMLAKLTELGVK